VKQLNKKPLKSHFNTSFSAGQKESCISKHYSLRRINKTNIINIIITGLRANVRGQMLRAGADINAMKQAAAEFKISS